VKYGVIIERTDTGFSAWVPDLPGCVATGATRDEVERNLREAIDLHLDGLRQDGTEIPEPTSVCATLEV
jgi:predicted RNase H-like HicB family nuclease